MKTILVSGASGIVGYGILKSLKNQDYHLIGTTIYDDSICEAFCDEFIQAIPTNDPNYIAWLIGVIKEHKVDMIIPGIEDDFYMWLDHHDELSKITAVLMNNTSLAELCRDKWAFYCESDLSYLIPTRQSGDFNADKAKFGMPFIQKPRRSFGSKGFKIINKWEDYSPSPHLISQPLVGDNDHEYTVSAFGDARGDFYNYICMVRKLDKAGFTGQAERVDIPEMKNILHDLCDYFKPEGPTNFQFRKYKGEFKLLEINPRISSSTSIKTLLGYNECLMAVDYYLNDIEPNQPQLLNGRIVRYTEDMVMS